VIDHDASPEDARRAAKSGKKTVLDVPPEAIEKEHKALQQEHGPGDHEANAVKRVAAKMIRQSSAIGGRIIGKENSKLSPEEKERRRKEMLERDAWCRRERKYRDSSPDGRGEPTEWLEGDKVKRILMPLAYTPLILPLRRSSSSTRTAAQTSVTSPRKSDVNRQRSTSPLSTRWDTTRKRWKPSSPAWLARSRTAVSAVSGGKGRNPKPSLLPRNVPLRLRLAASPNHPNNKAPSPKRRKQTGTFLPPLSTGRDSRWTGRNASSLRRMTRRRCRPSNRKHRRAELPRRQGSAAMQAVRGLFRPRANTAAESSRAQAAQPTADDESPNSQDQNGNPSIRFATQTRPDREGSTAGNGRPLPVVGSSISVRRDPSRRVEDQ
jgi:hypothetical protein